MTVFVTVLNFDIGTVDILRVETKATSIKELDSGLIEEILEFRGYKPKNIQYMVTEELSINMV